MGQDVGQRGSDKRVLLQNFLSEKRRGVKLQVRKIWLYKQRKGFSSEKANCIEMPPVRGVSSIAILG